MLLGAHTLSVLSVCMMPPFLFAAEDSGEVVIFAGSLQYNAQLQSMLFCLQNHAVMNTGKAQIRLICLKN